VGSNTGRVRSSDGRAWYRRDGESWLTALVDKPADRVTEQVAAGDSGALRARN
jgi:hypothetical protein